MERPGALYRPSPRLYTPRPQPLTYPAHFEVRRVAVDSTIRWKNRKVFVSSLLKHKDVGLEQIADQVWAVHVGPIKLGWLDEA